MGAIKLLPLLTALCLVIVLGLATLVWRSGPDSRITSLMEDHKIPGVAVAYLEGPKLKWIKAFGLADISAETPVSPQTRFHIASLTKDFMAAAILRMAEARELDLDDPVASHLDGDWNGITIRHLLTHTSGIPNFSERKWSHLADGIDEPTQIIPRLAEQTLLFPPGTEWRYSNSNYVLLGLIIEARSGQSAQDYFATTFFKPLGMTRTELPAFGSSPTKVATGYVIRADELVQGGRENALTLYTAGGAVSTIEDVVKWELAMQQGKVVSEESLNLMNGRIMLPDGPFPYGMGRLIDDDDNVSSSGEMPLSGYTARIIRTKDRRTVIALANSGDWRAAGRIARSVLHLDPNDLQNDLLAFTRGFE